MRDELNEPLGLEPRPDPFAKTGRALERVVAAIALVALGGGGVWIWHSREHRVPPIETAVRVETAKPASPALTAPAAPPSPAASATPAAADVEVTDGVKVVRNGGAGPPPGEVISVPAALGVRLPPAPDPRLIEKSRFGPLPRVGPDGSRPADIYSRPVMQAPRLANAPRIALVVGGLGLDPSGTAAAIARLPPAVSLGFAPYGQDLAAKAAEAREAGHEVLLQAPMEPFAGAAAPGPHMLTTAASETENRDSLEWMMGRFTGYIGVMNYLGGKYTADRAAFAPTLAEIASRGLDYLDDGSAPRSLALNLAPQLQLSAGAADVVIDETPTPDGIEAALARLEGVARRQKSAIGVATALPVSVDHIARWAEALQARGVALIPVSALLARPPNKSAGATP